MEGHQLKKERVMEDNQDHISLLPNSILSTIWSLLKIREAVGFSVLSTRWRYLWTTSLTNLTFDADNMLDKNDYSESETSTYHIGELHRLIISWKRKLSFINSVNQFLLYLGDDLKIDKLKVYFTFRCNKYGSHLDDWIDFAFSRKVEEIDLCLFEDTFFHVPDDGELYDFPCHLLDDYGGERGLRSFMKCLRLAYCKLAPGRSNFLGFSTLTSLDLNQVDLVSEKHIYTLLSNCAQLEWLSFCQCYNMDHLKINHPLCNQLKYLSVKDCHELEAIEFNGSNLEILEYKGFMIDFLFSNVQRLKTVFSHAFISRATNSVVCPLSTFRADLPQLETLILSCSSCSVEVLFTTFPTFSRLKHLSILDIPKCKHNLFRIATVLEATPTLQILELHLRAYEYVEEPKEITRTPSSSCLHDHLKKVVITGTHGCLSEIELAIYLLNSSQSLAKMVIDPRPRLYHGNGKWDILEACATWNTVGRLNIYEHLAREVCSPVELLIL
ncbi:F-box/FBD/LRR-repeat protein [Quillaja saponaria]|uniref:F-box/FBD/LRR-repeat protein n=1 Tax=Quillaja saponaria TaxID=32244 RepID=A0AAD7P643_QUISA|nr:F-box/FBD/LRR-repeat protein [Quillaja saponaria]